MGDNNLQPGDGHQLRRSSRIANRETREHQQSTTCIQSAIERPSENDNLQVGHIERLQIAADHARQTLNNLTSVRGRRSERQREQIRFAEQQVQEREEEAARVEEELISRAARHDPLIVQNIERLRNELRQARQVVQQLNSVRGRRSDQHRLQLLASEQLEREVKQALLISMRQLDQVRLHLFIKLTIYI